MKNIFIVIVGLIFFLLACNKGTNDIVEIELACTVNTFDAPIHAISKPLSNTDRLYLGLENGNIVKIEGDKRHIYSGGAKRVIYDIWEHNKDSLFIGTRDGGLKLITVKNDSCVKSEDFSIESKDLNYSVYSIAEDSINRILYIGTSNGLFKMDLKNNASLVMLEHVELGDKKQDGIHKVLFKDSTLFVAGDPGLFISKSHSQFFNPIKDVRVNNIILDNDTVYALTQNSIVKIDNPSPAKDSVYKTIALGEFYSYNRTPGNEEWLLSGRNVFFRRNGTTFRHKLPSGITPNSKQVGLMDNDFYYIAYRELLLAFPLRQNTQGMANSVIAVSDRIGGDDMVYFITSDFKLHKYRFNPTSKDKDESEPMGQIKGLNVNDEIVKFIHTGNNVFFLASKKNLYRIKGNTADCIMDFDKMDNDNDFSALYFSPGEQKLYIGTRRYLGSIDCSTKRKTLSEYTIEYITDMDTTDLYVVDISGRADDIYVVTLNKGLFGRKGKQAKFEKQWHSENEKYGSTYGMAMNGKEDLLLNTSEGIIYNDNIRTLGFLDIANIKAIYRVYEDNSSDGFFIIYYHGINYQRLTHSSIENRNQPFPLFKDIAFDKACIAVKGKYSILGSRYGLFLFDQSELTPITIQKEKDYTSLYIFIATILLLIGGILIYSFFRKKRQRYRGIKLNEYKDEMTTARIEKIITEVEQRIKNIMSLPKIRTNEHEQLLEEIIKDKDKVKTNIESQTAEQIDSLKEKLLTLENGLADCIAPYRQVFYEQYATDGIEKEIESLRERVDGKQTKWMIKKGCDDFVDAHSQLRKLSFMQKKRNDTRFYAAVLFFIPDIGANVICESLKLGEQKTKTIQKFKNSARECIEELYKQEPVMREDKIIGLLYSRLGGGKKSDNTSSLSNNAPKSDND